MEVWYAVVPIAWFGVFALAIASGRPALASLLATAGLLAFTTMYARRQGRGAKPADLALRGLLYGLAVIGAGAVLFVAEAAFYETFTPRRPVGLR